jgi:hypothetical protein
MSKVFPQLIVAVWLLAGKNGNWICLEIIDGSCCCFYVTYRPTLSKTDKDNQDVTLGIAGV